jgi:hypothetical protein
MEHGRCRRRYGLEDLSGVKKGVELMLLKYFIKIKKEEKLYGTFWLKVLIWCRIRICIFTVVEVVVHFE